MSKSNQNVVSCHTGALPAAGPVHKPAAYEPVRVEVKAVETAQVMCASGWSNGGYAPDLGGTNNVGEY